MIVKELDEMWISENEAVVVYYNHFSLGHKYTICRKVRYQDFDRDVWEYVISFDTIGEAITYAKKIHDVVVVR